MAAKADIRKDKGRRNESEGISDSRPAGVKLPYQELYSQGNRRIAERMPHVNVVYGINHDECGYEEKQRGNLVDTVFHTRKFNKKYLSVKKQAKKYQYQKSYFIFAPNQTKTAMPETFSEIVPLSSKDSFLIVERHKKEFTYPLHHHKEFELNFIQNGAGVRRIVGDNVEEIGDFDLVLIGSENLDHVWEQGRCTSPEIREITIQFSPELFNEGQIENNHFNSIRAMLKNAEYGLKFPMEAIMKVYSILDTLSAQKDGFYQYLATMRLLYELSFFKAEVLSSSISSQSPGKKDNRRISKVREYINAHYSEELPLSKLSGIAGMSPSSFSRYFKMRTGETLSTYIAKTRLGAAVKALVDSTQSISEICYSCGFNNLSNFNRLFKAKRGMSPREFRSLYKKQRVLF